MSTARSNVKVNIFDGNGKKIASIEDDDPAALSVRARDIMNNVSSGDVYASSIGKPEASPSTTEVDRSPEIVEPQRPEPKPRPQKKVVYDLPGYGTLEVSYHQIIRNGPILVLAYDKRDDLSVKFFPQYTENPIGIRFPGTDKMFLIRTTGISFEIDEKEVCVLFIQHEGSYREYQEALRRYGTATEAGPEEDDS